MNAIKTPKEVLKRKKANCVGYSNTTKAMLNSIGIPCMLVGGYAGDLVGKSKLSLLKENHEWNMVYYDNSWHYIDVTWDSINVYYGKGNKNNKRNESPSHKYYNPSAKMMGNNHISMKIFS